MDYTGYLTTKDLVHRAPRRGNYNAEMTCITQISKILWRYGTTFYNLYIREECERNFFSFQGGGPMESIDKKREGAKEEDSVKTKRPVQPKTVQLYVTQEPTEETSETEEHDGYMRTRPLYHKHK